MRYGLGPYPNRYGYQIRIPAGVHLWRSIRVTMNKIRKKNMKRLGGSGLSLEAFANAKSTTSHYNPALIKKQREFYKNAKCVGKYKKMIKQQSQHYDISSAVKPLEDENKSGEGRKVINNDRKSKKNGTRGLIELYEKQCEEKEKAMIERDVIIKEKKEEREKAKARRKDAREKMFKKTRYGQPVMKYRIEHLLKSIQDSNSNSVST